VHCDLITSLHLSKISFLFVRNVCLVYDRRLIPPIVCVCVCVFLIAKGGNEISIADHCFLFSCSMLVTARRRGGFARRQCLLFPWMLLCPVQGNIEMLIDTERRSKIPAIIALRKERRIFLVIIIIKFFSVLLFIYIYILVGLIKVRI